MNSLTVALVDGGEADLKVELAAVRQPRPNSGTFVCLVSCERDVGGEARGRGARVEASGQAEASADNVVDFLVEGCH